MMQIKSIVLYNGKGETRQLNFELNKVNLITGDHDTGKSALIPIINYCLGCSGFEIPDGVIQDNVEWYAVLYQIGNMQAFIAKPKPKYGKKEHQAFYKVSEKIDIPTYENLVAESTSSDYYVKKDLSLLLRQSLNLPLMDYEQIENLKTTIEYTHFYLFQPIDVIVSKELFYKQRSDFKIIKETLPYFLGAKNEDELILQEKYEKKSRELQIIKQTLKRYQENIKNNEEKIRNFFTRAQSLNLIENDLLTNSIDSYEMIKKLKNIFNLKSSIDFSMPSDFEPELRQNLNKRQQEYNEKIYQLNLIKSYNEDIDSYSKETTEHRMRLQSIGLFENKTQSIFVDEKYCPLCHSEISQNIPEILSMQNSLKQLDNNLKSAGRDKINSDKQYEHLEKEIKLKDGEIKIIQSNLYKIAKEKKLKNDFFKKLEIEQGNIKEFIGRIKEFFETNQPTENIGGLNEKQKLLEQELETFKSKIAQSDNVLAHKLDTFNEKISLFASEIGLSHQGRYLFSLDNIDITVKDENHPRPISMKSIGGLNILGFHLITLLGLHQYFIYEKSPVPSFLILDQPIQGYSSDNKNDDTDKINKMIQLVLKVCKDSGLQVILTEYEQLSQEELHRVEEKHWTTDYALIPKKWIQ